MRVSTVAGIGSAASLLASIGVPIAFPNVEPWVGQVLLGIAGFLFALMVGLVWARRDGDDGGGTTITTGGPNSPGFGSVGGNVTITHHHPPQEPQRPDPRVEYVQPAIVDVLKRGLTPVELRPIPDGDARNGMPVWQALHKIAARIGDTNELDGFPEARRQFRQEALQGRVSVWGQEQIPPGHMKDDRHRDIWEPIEDSYWSEYRLHPRAAKEEMQESAHTEEEELPSRKTGRYWNLMVHASDINRCWPKPRRETYDGYH